MAWKSRESPGSRRESSPITRPRSRPASLGGNSREIDRPTNARNTCVARTNGLEAGPRRSNSLAWSSADDPLVAATPPRTPGRRACGGRLPARPGPRARPSVESPSPCTQTDSWTSAAPSLQSTRAEIDHRVPAEAPDRRILRGATPWPRSASTPAGPAAIRRAGRPRGPPTPWPTGRSAEQRQRGGAEAPSPHGRRLPRERRHRGWLPRPRDVPGRWASGPCVEVRRPPRHRRARRHRAPPRPRLRTRPVGPARAAAPPRTRRRPTACAQPLTR